jgi:hypothetical protein
MAAASRVSTGQATRSSGRPMRRLRALIEGVHFLQEALEVLFDAQGAQGQDDRAELGVGQQAAAQAVQIKGQGAGLLARAEVRDPSELLSQPVAEGLLIPMIAEGLEGLAEGVEVMEGELPHPIGHAVQALPGGFPEELLLRLPQEILQAPAGVLGLAEALQGVEGVADEGGAGEERDPDQRAQLLPDFEQDIRRQAEMVAGHASLPVRGFPLDSIVGASLPPVKPRRFVGVSQNCRTTASSCPTKRPGPTKLGHTPLRSSASRRSDRLPAGSGRAGRVMPTSRLLTIPGPVLLSRHRDCRAPRPSLQ